jgi:hypothetical protein
MAKTERYENRIEILQGTLDLLILQTLQWGPQHGYGISQTTHVNSGEVLRVDTGSLYPALHRLERKRWIASKWRFPKISSASSFIGLQPLERNSCSRSIQNGDNW